MEPFATLEDYRKRYGDVEDDDAADAALEDASVLIRSYTTDAPADAARFVACSVAHRLLGSPYANAGATSYTLSADGFTETQQFGGTGAGAIYLTRAERRMLGCGLARIGFAAPAVGKEAS